MQATDPLIVTDHLGRRCIVVRGRLMPVPAGGSDTSTAGADQDTDGDTDDDSTGSESDDDAGSEGDTDQDTDGGAEKQFSQADVDKAVQDRLARERKKWEKKVEREKEKARSEAQQASDQAGEAATSGASDERVQQLQQRAVKGEAKTAALAAGVSPDRMQRFLRLVDLDDVEVDDDGEVDEDDVADRVKAALEEVPEFAGKTTTGGSGASKSGGDGHQGDDSGEKLLTREQMKKMTPEEINENWDQVQRSMAALGGK